jgi:hypothetical protein
MAAFLAAGGMSGCASESSTQVQGNVRTSGFLQDYSMLTPGGEGQGISMYWNESADFARYDKLIIDPVTVWTTYASDLSGLPAAEKQELANQFHKELIEVFGQDYELVDYPGPDTMRLRVALTAADASNVTMDTISTYVPQARLLSSVVTIGSDTAAFVGSATAEADLRDAESGELLAAGVDRRAGTKAIGKDTFDSWGDVRESFGAWAQQALTNLRKHRGS